MLVISHTYSFTGFIPPPCALNMQCSQRPEESTDSPELELKVVLCQVSARNGTSLTSSLNHWTITTAWYQHPPPINQLTKLKKKKKVGKSHPCSFSVTGYSYSTVALWLLRAGIIMLLWLVSKELCRVHCLPQHPYFSFLSAKITSVFNSDPMY